jgi:hypothetical protein
VDIGPSMAGWRTGHGGAGRDATGDTVDRAEGRVDTPGSLSTIDLSDPTDHAHAGSIRPHRRPCWIHAPGHQRVHSIHRMMTMTG